MDLFNGHTDPSLGPLKHARAVHPLRSQDPGNSDAFPPEIWLGISISSPNGFQLNRISIVHHQEAK
jgi:hypothetical protein